MGLYEIKCRVSRGAEKALIWAVWKLPRRLVMWCAVRVISHATAGQWSSQNVPELTAMDALKRWESP